MRASAERLAAYVREAAAHARRHRRRGACCAGSVAFPDPRQFAAPDAAHECTP